MDYRGDVNVILINHSTMPFMVEKGDRIAQMVMCPVVQAAFEVVKTLSETKRGKDGFGSSGIR